MDQTYRNLEIICVNDGSTDASLDILNRLKEEDSRIVVLTKKNSGLGDTRNCGIDASTSEWIAFVDSDDCLHREALECISRAFPYEPDMVHYGINVIYDDGVGLRKGDTGYYSIVHNGLVCLNDDIVSDVDCSACNKLFRRSVLDRYGIRFEHIQYEDFVFSMQYMLMSRKVYYIPDKLYDYFRHEGSIMSTTFNRTPRAIEHMYAMGYLFDFSAEHGIIDAHRELLCRLFGNYYVLSLTYSTRDMIPQIVDFATELYGKYVFLHDSIERKVENRTIVFRKKRHLSTRMMEHLFSIRKEYIDYELYKVVRMFGVIVYRTPKS